MNKDINKESILLDTERQRCEVFTRVMGYIRPISEFNIGKQQEHADRLHFSEKKIDCTCVKLHTECQKYNQNDKISYVA